MGILGTILLIFIVTHMINFWYEYKFGSMDWKTYIVDATTGNILKQETVPAADAAAQKLKPTEMDYMGNEVIICKDLYSVVAKAFKNPAVVAFYVISMLALSYHLLHGFQSSFQTMGIRRKKYEGLIRGTGTFIFGILIPALFAAMPIYFLFVNK
jgi:succinate dehydrogenase / fumarate reductase cytochrome b subunit